MADITIKTVQPTRKVNTPLMAAAGAAVGAAARYALPTKDELHSLINKENVDTFVYSASAVARANGRSILKYGTIGALVASGIALVTNAFRAKDKEEELANVTYSKYGAAIDSSDYAYMVMSWGD